MPEVYAVLSMLLASWDCLPKLRHFPGLSFLLCISFPLACEVQETRFHFMLTRSVCCVYCVVPQLVESIRRSCWVFCPGAAHLMS